MVFAWGGTWEFGFVDLFQASCFEGRGGLSGNVFYMGKFLVFCFGRQLVSWGPGNTEQRKKKKPSSENPREDRDFFVVTRGPFVLTVVGFGGPRRGLLDNLFCGGVPGFHQFVQEQKSEPAGWLFRPNFGGGSGH